MITINFNIDDDNSAGLSAVKNQAKNENIPSPTEIEFRLSNGLETAPPVPQIFEQESFSNTNDGVLPSPDSFENSQSGENDSIPNPTEIEHSSEIEATEENGPEPMLLDEIDGKKTTKTTKSATKK